MTTKELVQDFLKLQNAYSFTDRKLITAERYTRLVQSGLVPKKDYENVLLHEPLIEHVGHLPILASFMYPHIHNKDSVDLGRVLIMLSVHDIGETVTGDIFPYHKKTKEDGLTEYKIALKVLDKHFRPYMEEYEENETFDAKFAKSIDILAPNIHEVDMPKVSLERFAMLGATVEDVVCSKRKYMQWDPFLLEVFDLLMEQYKAVEQNHEPIFEPEAYDKI